MTLRRSTTAFILIRLNILGRLAKARWCNGSPHHHIIIISVLSRVRARKAVARLIGRTVSREYADISNTLELVLFSAFLAFAIP